jgi:hypothetical protein
MWYARTVKGHLQSRIPPAPIYGKRPFFLHLFYLELRIAVGRLGGAWIQLIQDPPESRLGSNYKSMLDIGALAKILENHVHNLGTALKA